MTETFLFQTDNTSVISIILKCFAIFFQCLYSCRLFQGPQAEHFTQLENIYAKIEQQILIELACEPNDNHSPSGQTFSSTAIPYTN